MVTGGRPCTRGKAAQDFEAGKNSSRHRASRRWDGIEMAADQQRFFRFARSVTQ